MPQHSIGRTWSVPTDHVEPRSPRRLATVVAALALLTAAPAAAQQEQWFGLAGVFVQGSHGQTLDTSGMQTGVQVGVGRWLSDHVGAGVEAFGATMWTTDDVGSPGRVPALSARRDVGVVGLVTARPGGADSRWRLSIGGGLHRISAADAVACCAPSVVIEQRAVRNRLTLAGGVDTRLLPSRIALFVRAQYTPQASTVLSPPLLGPLVARVGSRRGSDTRVAIYSE